MRASRSWFAGCGGRVEAVSGRTCLVTGATSGIGKETAAQLAALGAAVAIVARDAGRGTETVAEGLGPHWGTAPGGRRPHETTVRPARRPDENRSMPHRPCVCRIRSRLGAVTGADAPLASGGRSKQTREMWLEPASGDRRRRPTRPLRCGGCRHHREI